MNNFERSMSLAKFRKGSTGSTIRKTVEQNRTDWKKETTNQDLIVRASNYWSALRSVKDERKRNLRYKNGDQWSDYVVDENGKVVKEEVLLSRQGRTPLKHNFIQQFIRNIMGQSVSNDNKSVVSCLSSDDTDLSEMLTNTLQACNNLNKNNVIGMNALEELLITGMCVAKVRYDFFSEKNRPDGKIEMVNINRLFFNTDIEDPRFNEDLNFIGEYHDYTMNDILRNFASTTQDEDALKEILRHSERDYSISMDGMTADKLNNVNAFTSSIDASKHRIIEVWEKLGRWVTYIHDYSDGSEKITTLPISEINKLNQERVAQCLASGIEPTQDMLMFTKEIYEHYWNVKYLTVYGHCLKEIETPFTHESHPYVIGTLPMIDGGIRSVIGDLIDQQRYINRLIVMIDSIIGAGAKGVLMIPESAIPEGYSARDFADEFVKVDGVIVYKDKIGGEKPYQISKNSTDVGGFQMLQLQMQLLEQISGISGAMQGQKASNNKPSSLYAQEAQNSSINFAVLFACFNSFNKDKDEKLLKVLMQFYTDKRHVDISGSSFIKVSEVYDPEKVKRIIDFNVVVNPSCDTPVFRQMQEDVLMSLVDKRLLPLDVAIEHTDMPILKSVKASLDAQKEQMQGQQQAQQMQGQVPQGQITQQ